MGMLGLMWIVYRVYKSLCLWKVPMKHENTTATVCHVFYGKIIFFVLIM